MCSILLLDDLLSLVFWKSEILWIKNFEKIYHGILNIAHSIVGLTKLTRKCANISFKEHLSVYFLLV